MASIRSSRFVGTWVEAAVSGPLRLLGFSLVAAALLWQPRASAVHFRGAIFGWHREPAAGLHGVSFVVPFTVRRSGYKGSAGDGYPAVGDVVLEDIGGTQIYFGDTKSTTTLYMKVIAIDSINDVMTSYLQESGTLTPGEIRHDYPDGNPYTARIDSCCRIEADPLNSVADYRLKTVVQADSPNHCPTTNFVSNVDAQKGTTLQFQLFAFDADKDPLSYREATTLESGLIAIPNTTVDPATGLVTWPIPANQTEGPYGYQIVVSDGECVVPVDFTITVRATTGNHPPVFDNPPTPCGTTVNSFIDTPMSFTVQAHDQDAPNKVYLNNTGLPGTATFPVGAAANPASTLFSWTPDDSYSNKDALVVFTASDGALGAIPCSVNVHVSGEVPHLSSIVPDNGPSLGGTSVTITGDTFQSGAVVKFGGSECVVTAFSATSITCTTTAHATGLVDVVIINPDGGSGTKKNAYTYTCAGTPPGAALGPGTTLCSGQTSHDLSVTLTGTPPWTLYWSDGVVESGITTSPHLRTVSPSYTTSYLVNTVTDANCGGAGSGSANIVVAEPVLAIVTGTDVSVCPGGGAAVHASLAGAPPFQVKWSDGVMQTYNTSPVTRIVTPSTTTVYSVTSLADSTGCSATLSGGLTVHVVQNPSAVITADTAVCPATTSHTASVPDAGAGATYDWVITGGTITAGAGTHSITYTSGAGPTLSLGITVLLPPGCSSSSSTQLGVGAPSATIIGNSTVYPAPSVDVQVALTGTAPWTINWSDGAVQSGITKSPATRTITPLRQTVYSLTSVTNGTCSGNVSGSVTAIPQGVGDANGDGNLTVSDVFWLINYLFAGGPAPLRSADANHDNFVNVSDVFFLINYLFAGGPHP